MILHGNSVGTWKCYDFPRVASAELQAVSGMIILPILTGQKKIVKILKNLRLRNANPWNSFISGEMYVDFFLTHFSGVFWQNCKIFGFDFMISIGPQCVLVFVFLLLALIFSFRLLRFATAYYEGSDIRP